MAAVAFNLANWQALYPEFSSTVNSTNAPLFFTLACQYLNNTDSSPVGDLIQREQLLWMLVAHIAALRVGLNAAAANQLVGRISQATEGTVTVQTDMGVVPNTAAWYMQTKYGADFWAMTAPFRQFRYFR